jgi:hypothetical protein
MKILVIPDLHGKNIWEKAVAHTDWDHVVFLGDYVDAWKEDDSTIVNNLVKIIRYKTENYARTTLLKGNHDAQYIFLEDRRWSCSGFRQSYALKLNLIFRNNIKLFRLAKIIDNFLFTHAGIHTNWYEKNFKYIYKDFPIDHLPIDEQIHMIEQTHYEGIFAEVGVSRGGSYGVGSLLWADWSDFKKKEDVYTNNSLTQIVGHSRVGRPIQKTIKKNDSSVDTLNIWFTDSLDQENNVFLYIEDGVVKNLIL